MFNPLVEVTFRLAKKRLLRESRAAASARPATAAHLESADNYDDFRNDVCSREFERGFSKELVRDKTVLEFGCGYGAFSHYLAEIGAKSVLGTDLETRSIEHATANKQSSKVSYFLATDPKTIALPDSSVDIITCFDVMEHVMDYREIIAEWHRVLTPGGRVLISWEPYYSPYGHHAYLYIPIPWIHVYLNDAQQNSICARIVDLPEFDPPWWDQDESGNKINRFRRADANDGGFLNELTMRSFEKICRQNQLHVEERILRSFGGSRVGSVVGGLLTKFPFVREFVTSNVYYTLRKM